MIYFCADDYGISQGANAHIEALAGKGLNKVSVLPNGNFGDLSRLQGVTLSLHLNLVEGKCLSDPKEIPLLATEDGMFRHSFVGLLKLSLLKPKALQTQLAVELRSQLMHWKAQIGDAPVCIDSHQHTHAIPLILRTLLAVLQEEGIRPTGIRIPWEPVRLYLGTPGIWCSCRPVGAIKQQLLNFLLIGGRRKLKKAGLPPACVMGIMFSGRMAGKHVETLLPKYEAFAAKRGMDAELVFHPGYVEQGETFMEGVRPDFCKFYFSPWRKKEFETVNNL